MAANFGCDRFRFIPDFVPKLLSAAIWSQVLFDSNLSRCPFLRQAAACAVLFLGHIFTRRPITDIKVEQGWAKQWELLIACFGRQQRLTEISPLAIPSKISFHIKKKSDLCCPKLQSIKTFLTLELSHYCKSGSTFSSSRTVTASSDCSWIRNTLCLC